MFEKQESNYLVAGYFSKIRIELTKYKNKKTGLARDRL
jgi:hypothetical protein